MKAPMNAQLMPTVVTERGGSVHQQMGMMPAQAGSFERANTVPTVAQAAAGAAGVARGVQQQLATADHQGVTAGLNFMPGPNEADVRNVQAKVQAQAQDLGARYRAAIAAHAAQLPPGAMPLRGPIDPQTGRRTSALLTLGRQALGIG